jgi:hypothetical protein
MDSVDYEGMEIIYYNYANYSDKSSMCEIYFK